MCSVTDDDNSFYVNGVGCCCCCCCRLPTHPSNTWIFFFSLSVRSLLVGSSLRPLLYLLGVCYSICFSFFFYLFLLIRFCVSRCFFFLFFCFFNLNNNIRWYICNIVISKFNESLYTLRVLLNAYRTLLHIGTYQKSFI